MAPTAIWSKEEYRYFYTVEQKKWLYSNRKEEYFYTVIQPTDAAILVAQVGAGVGNVEYQ